MKSTEHLDRIDFALLMVLQKNARLANNRLAELVGVAPSTCLERVRRLARLGVIKGYHCDVDPAAPQLLDAQEGAPRDFSPVPRETPKSAPSSRISPASPS